MCPEVASRAEVPGGRVRGDQDAEVGEEAPDVLDEGAEMLLEYLTLKLQWRKAGPLKSSR